MYAYCAVRGDVSARALRKLPALPEAAPPRPLPLIGDITLIVADVPAAAYAADKIDSRLGDLDWVGRCGSAHHAVADALVGKQAVVPLRPFTLFSNETKAHETFRALAASLEDAFDRVAGKTEWVVRIGKPDPARIKAVAAATRATPKSGAAFLAQKAAARRHAAELAARIHDDAARLYRAVLKVVDAGEKRTGDAGTNLLLDAAFLVGSRQTTAFKRTIEAVAGGLLEAGCRVSVTGPWPPYSFVALEPGSDDE